MIGVGKNNNCQKGDGNDAEIINMPLDQVKKLIEEYEPYDKTLGEIARDLICEKGEV